MKKLPVMAVSVFLGLVACSDDNGAVAPSENEAALPGAEISSSSDFTQNSGTFGSGGATSGDDETDLEDARVLDGTEILLKVSGTTATVENNNGCVTVENQSATITCPGAYYVTGESSDFQVVVNTPAAENEGNIGIYLYNAILKSSNSPILVKNAGKAVLHLVKGSTNVVEDGKGVINISGGATSTFATDDGWNGAGGPKDANGTATMTGGDFPGGDFPGGGMGMGGGGCSTNISGGLIDTDNGFTITGGVLLAFGDYTTDVPDCATISYTSDNYYGSEKAAFKPTYKGNTILYGGEVKSVGQVETSGMAEFKFPKGVSYMYK